LLPWAVALAPTRGRVVLTHGEAGPRPAPARNIQPPCKLPSRLTDLPEPVELCAQP
jgi:hypothetical protein